MWKVLLSNTILLRFDKWRIFIVKCVKYPQDFFFHALLWMLLCISELCWLRNRKTFHFKCDSQIVFRKLFWQNAPFTPVPWVRSLNRKTDVCVWCTRRPLLTEKDDEETDSTDTADLTGSVWSSCQRDCTYERMNNWCSVQTALLRHYWARVAVLKQ